MTALRSKPVHRGDPMKPTTIVIACVTAALVGFLIGAVLGAFSVTGQAASAAKTHYPPPTGDQFREGPVLVRLPGASTTTNFIF